jgi:riboflavin kinase / FMN adenylyltransferase
MKIFRSFEEAHGIMSPVVTTGTFDGVHIGHKVILRRLKKLAEECGGESVLITFHPHPRAVLYPETSGKDLKLINTQEEKIELLRKAGLDNVIIIEFTRDFARTTSEEFVSNYLCGMLRSKVIVVGKNHHFGFNKEGDYRHLWKWREQYSFEAEEISMQEVQHETVSSTRIRQALAQGYIQRANAYLDHYYILIGTPEFPAEKFSDEVPFIKVPVKEETKLLPPEGLYAVTCAGDAFFSKGMAYIKEDKDDRQDVYLHICNYDKDIPGKRITLFFHKRLEAWSPSVSVPVALRWGLAEMNDLIF